MRYGQNWTISTKLDKLGAGHNMDIIGQDWTKLDNRDKIGQ